jgi:hypothetical protein
MSTVLIDRKTLRESLATLLAAELVGAGKPVSAVYAYQVADTKGKSPVVFVTSAGAWRRNPEHSTRAGSIAYLDVNILVLYSDGTTSWTEQHSEERLDLIEKKIGEVVANNSENPAQPWMFLDFAGRSEVTSVVIGGKDYSWEIIPLQAQLWAA